MRSLVRFYSKGTHARSAPCKYGLTACRHNNLQLGLKLYFHQYAKTTTMGEKSKFRQITINTINKKQRQIPPK